MSSSPVIGVDLGGTFIKAIRTSDKGGIDAQDRIGTEADRGPDHVIEQIIGLVLRLASGHDVVGIGIGSPGPLDIKRGVVIRSANLPGWVDVPLRETLERRLGHPVFLANDANAAAYGEYWQGAGRGSDPLCLLTLGTGVGGGVIIGGSILQGHFDNAGELGHMIVHRDGLRCSCGQHGCVEAYASASNMLARARAALSEGTSSTLRRYFDEQTLDAPHIISGAAEGDSLAVTLWSDACHALALACINMQHAFNPQRVLLGGGMSAAGAQLIEPVTRLVQQHSWKLAQDQPEIVLASLGNDAGALGAAGWALHNLALIPPD